VPIHIFRKILRTERSAARTTNNEELWVDGLEEEEEEDNDDDVENTQRVCKKNQETFVAEREALQTAAYKYGFFQRSLKTQNIARSENRIRIPVMEIGNDKEPQPKLIVEIVVNPHEDLPDDTSSTACLELVRMVNSVPLLDGAESFACGLVKAVQSSAIWASFGLSVLGSSSPENASWSSELRVRDSDQVAPFFQSHTHQQWEDSQKSSHIDHDNDDVEGSSESQSSRKKRGRNTNDLMLPAKVRLSKILLLVDIRAAPSTLPLPSLSKGRLPVNHSPIMQAFQLGLRDCLRSLQMTSPGLLLTAAQLRTVERDVRYIPLMAGTVAGILGRMSDRAKQQNLLRKVQNMHAEDQIGGTPVAFHPGEEPNLNTEEIIRIIEHRTSNSVHSIESAKTKKKIRTKPEKKASDDEIDFGDLENSDSGSRSCICETNSGGKTPAIKYLNHVTLESESSIGDENSSVEGVDSSAHQLKYQVDQNRHSPKEGAPESVDDDDDDDNESW